MARTSDQNDNEGEKAARREAQNVAEKADLARQQEKRAKEVAVTVSVSGLSHLTARWEHPARGGRAPVKLTWYDGKQRHSRN